MVIILLKMGTVLLEMENFQNYGNFLGLIGRTNYGKFLIEIMGNFDSSRFYSKFLSKLDKSFKKVFLGHFSLKYFVLIIVCI